LGGASVAVSSNSGAVTVPLTVNIAAGGSTANFGVATLGVANTVNALITASYAGLTATAPLTVNPVAVTLNSVALGGVSVTGGASLTGTVTLSGAAPTGGVSVALSSNSGAIQVPLTATVAAGSTSGTFPIQTSAVAAALTGGLSAAYGGVTQTASLTVIPPVLQSLTLPAGILKGGLSMVGTVALNGPAPTGGVPVQLHSNSLLAILPASVTIPAGQTSTTFNILSLGTILGNDVTLTATALGNTLSTPLRINP